MAAELKGPNPCVTEADEEGWMLVNLPGEYQHREWSGRILKPYQTGKQTNCVL